MTTPLQGPELASVHATRLEIMKPVVRDALAAAGPEPTAVDLGCNEGWFGHRLLDWGASRVVGIDVREVNIRRALLIRDHFGVPSERLELKRANVFDVSPAALGQFDVVLALGLIYHLENPIGALRLARSLTRGVAIVESQLTACNEPIRVGQGETGRFHDVTAHWAMTVEPAHEQAADGNMLSSFGGVASLVPNRAALLAAMSVAGWHQVRPLEPVTDSNRQYVDGDRAVAAGFANDA